MIKAVLGEIWDYFCSAGRELKQVENDLKRRPDTYLEDFDLDPLELWWIPKEMALTAWYAQFTANMAARRARISAAWDRNIEAIQRQMDQLSRAF